MELFVILLHGVTLSHPQFRHVAVFCNCPPINCITLCLKEVAMRNVGNPPAAYDIAEVRRVKHASSIITLATFSARSRVS